MRDERAGAAVEAVPEEFRFTTFHLISTDGRGFYGGAAVIETLVAIRGTSSPARLLRSRPLRRLVDVFYAFLARSKRVLGRFVKDAPGPERWP